MNSVTVSTVLPSIYYEVMGPDVMILGFRMLSFKPIFSLSSFTFIKRLFSSSSLSSIRMVSYAYLRLLIFLLASKKGWEKARQMHFLISKQFCANVKTVGTCNLYQLWDIQYFSIKWWFRFMVKSEVESSSLQSEMYILQPFFLWYRLCFRNGVEFLYLQILQFLKELHFKN